MSARLAGFQRGRYAWEGVAVAWEANVCAMCGTRGPIGVPLLDDEHEINGPEMVCATCAHAIISEAEINEANA